MYERDKNFKNPLRRCKRDNIRLKKWKVEYCLQDLVFHDHLLTENSIKPDPKIINAICEMP